MDRNTAKNEALFWIDNLRKACTIYCTDREEAFKMLSEFSKKPLSHEVMMLIGEFLEEDKNKPKQNTETGEWSYTVPDKNAPHDRNLISRALDLYRGRFDGSIGYGVYNLVTILKKTREDLSGENLSALDLRHCSFSGIFLENCSNGTDMTGAIIDKNSIMPVLHKKPVEMISFMPDGSCFATSSQDNHIKIWNSLTLKLLKDLECTAYRAITYSPCGKYLAAAAYDGVKIWETASYSIVTEINTTIPFARCVRFSPDSQYIAVSYGNKVVVWSISSQQFQYELNGHADTIEHFAYNRDGSKMVTASNDHSAIVWNTETASIHSVLSDHKGDITCVEYSPDWNTIATISEDGTIKIWDAQTYCLKKSIDSDSSYYGYLSFSADGKCLASSSFHHELRLWNTDNYESIRRTHAHDNAIHCVTFSPDGKKLYSASFDQTLKIWDTDTLSHISTIECRYDWVNSAKISPGGMCFATANYDGTVRFWDMDSGMLMHTVKSHTREVNSIAFSSDKRLISSSSDHHIIELDTKHFIISHDLDAGCWVEHADYSPNGTLIIGSLDFATIKIWERESCRLLKEHRCNKYGGSPKRSSYIHNGTKIITIPPYENSVQILNADDLSVEIALEGHSRFVTDVKLNHSETRIATASEDSTVKVWDAYTFVQLASLFHDSEVRSIAFSPDDKYIATGAYKTIYIWDSHTFKRIAELHGHTGSVRDVSYSADGNRLISASWDGTTRIWDTSSHECLRTIYNIPGLYVLGCDMRNLHPDANLTDNDKKILRQYGAILD